MELERTNVVFDQFECPLGASGLPRPERSLQLQLTLISTKYLQIAYRIR